MEKQVSLKKNLVSMYLMHGSNFIFPLITLPYLVRVLGPDKYGLLTFVQGFIQYFLIITDYGFNLSATRQIAINRGDNTKVSKIFCATIFLKLVFMLTSFILLSTIIITIPKFRHDGFIYLLAFLSVLGSVFFRSGSTKEWNRFDIYQLYL